MPATEDFIAAARVAADAFGIDAAKIEPLSHSENVVVQIATTDGERLVKDREGLWDYLQRVDRETR